MTVGFATFNVADYLDDDEVIAEYLAAAAEDSNPDVLLAALAEVAKAREWRKLPLQQDSAVKASIKHSRLALSTL